MPEFGQTNWEGLRGAFSPSRFVNSLKRGLDYRYEPPTQEPPVDNLWDAMEYYQYKGDIVGALLTQRFMR